MGVILFCSRQPYPILLKAVLIYYNPHQWSGITLVVGGTNDTYTTIHFQDIPLYCTKHHYPVVILTGP